MGTLLGEAAPFRSLSPLDLAFVGDAVYDLLTDHSCLLKRMKKLGKD